MRRNRRFNRIIKAAKVPAKKRAKPCPVCKVSGAKPCKNKNGKPMGRPHKARYADD